MSDCKCPGAPAEHYNECAAMAPTYDHAVIECNRCTRRRTVTFDQALTRAQLADWIGSNVWQCPCLGPTCSIAFHIKGRPATLKESLL